MKVFFTILILLCFCLTGCGNNNSKNIQEENSNYVASSINSTDNTNNVEIKNNANIETEIASFSTKIYTPNDEARQNNIRITSSKLNGCIVKSR